MTTAETVTLRFPAQPEFLVLARLALAGIAQARWVDPEIVADLKLAVTEACANVVRHAYDVDDHVRDVTVTIELSAGSITVRVDDDGAGFVVPEPRASFDQDVLTPDANGMGLSIIRAVADDVRITTGPNGRGTSVLLSKSLAAAQPGQMGSV